MLAFLLVRTIINYQPKGDLVQQEEIWVDAVKR
jgi:hypothetical protein